MLIGCINFRQCEKLSVIRMTISNKRMRMVRVNIGDIPLAVSPKLSTIRRVTYAIPRLH